MSLDDQQLIRELQHMADAPVASSDRLRSEVDRRIARRGRRRGRVVAGVAAALLLVVAGVAVVLTHQADRPRRTVTNNPTSPVAPTTPAAVPTTLAPVPPGRTEAGWTSIATPALAGRTEAALIWAGNGLFLWGGGLPDEPVFYNDGAWYDPGTGMWTPLPAAPLSARKGATVAWTGTEVIVWGGRAPAGPLGTNPGPHSAVQPPAVDGAAYDPGHHRWRRLENSPFPVRSPYPTGARGLAPLSSGSVWTDRRVVVVYPRASADADVAAYDPTADKWESLPSPGPIGAVLSVTWTGSEVLLTADSEMGTFSPVRVLRLRPGATSWTSVELPGAGGALYRPAWNGRELTLITNQSVPGNRELPTIAIQPSDLSLRQLARYPLGCEGPVEAASEGATVFAESCGGLFALDRTTEQWSPVAVPSSVHDGLWDGLIGGGRSLWSISTGVPPGLPNVAARPPAAWRLPIR